MSAGRSLRRGPAGGREHRRRRGPGSVGLLEIVDAVQVPVLVLDVRGDSVWMNAAALRLHGCRTEDECQMRLSEYMERFEARTLDGRVLGRDERPTGRALRGELVHDVELEVRQVATGRRWVGVYGAEAVITSDGRRLVTVTIHDVTELKRAMAALHEEDRRKSEFLGVLSHELRNPLAPIRSAVFLLGRADPSSDAARRAREVIARQVGHLARLVDDLLDVSRIARGRIELRRVRLDLAETVRRTAEDHRDLFAEAGVELEVDVPEGPIPVDGDATRLGQVVGSLLQNSAKFTQRGGSTSVSVRAAGGEAEIRVRDTGAGIDRELVGRVFEPFVQAERTLARTRGGLGVGLALVKGLVELHGGSVSARSEGSGAGAEFTVRIPLAPGPEAGRGAAAEDLGSSRARRVLVVDDNVDAAESLSDLVAHFGHTVEVVHDGRTAVERVREIHPDVVLCDIGLPDMDGYEVARAVRADQGLREVRLVAVSGYAQSEDRERARRAGFDAHVAKPADPAAIARLIG